MNRFSSQKNTFGIILVIVAVSLVFLPFFSVFNNVLTSLVMKMNAYRFVQEYIVPAEVRLVGVFLYPFSLKPSIVGTYLAINVDPKPFLIEIAWNCVGWQSLIFFLITGWVGLQGDRYKSFSKIKAWILGLVGTFLVNIVRIVTIVLSAYFFGQSVASIIHDYGSTIWTMGWLIFYWWFTYGFVLEDKEVFQV